jgi:hypothetical protein
MGINAEYTGYATGRITLSTTQNRLDTDGILMLDAAIGK